MHPSHEGPESADTVKSGSKMAFAERGSGGDLRAAIEMNPLRGKRSRFRLYVARAAMLQGRVKYPG